MACMAAQSPADQDRFICIYHSYLNNKKTIAEGRRIPISKAVENPIATEIQDVCSAVGLNAFLEKNKMYSKRMEPWCSVQRQSPGSAQTGRWQPLSCTVPVM
ncbi:Signal recognition particle 19 kDa protein [Lemmus lemmus]